MKTYDTTSGRSEPGLASNLPCAEWAQPELAGQFVVRRWRANEALVSACLSEPRDVPLSARPRRKGQERREGQHNDRNDDAPHGSPGHCRRDSAVLLDSHRTSVAPSRRTETPDKVNRC